MIFGADDHEDPLLGLRLIDRHGSDDLTEVENLLLDYRLRIEVG